MVSALLLSFAMFSGVTYAIRTVYAAAFLQPSLGAAPILEDTTLLQCTVCRLLLAAWHHARLLICPCWAAQQLLVVVSCCLGYACQGAHCCENACELESW
jgi:hypothetical protein